MTVIESMLDSLLKIFILHYMKSGKMDKGKNLIDPEDNSVVFSKMNGNEFTFAYSL